MIHNNMKILKYLKSYPKNIKNTDKINDNIMTSIKEFIISLQKTGFNINNVNVIYTDENFIDLSITIDNIENLFYIVTKKYYEENVFHYDELYKFELMPKNIFIPNLYHWK